MSLVLHLSASCRVAQFPHLRNKMSDGLLTSSCFPPHPPCTGIESTCVDVIQLRNILGWTASFDAWSDCKEQGRHSVPLLSVASVPLRPSLRLDSVSGG